MAAGDVETYKYDASDYTAISTGLKANNVLATDRVTAHVVGSSVIFTVIKAS